MRRSVGSFKESSDCGKCEENEIERTPKQAVKEYTTWPEMIKHWPKTTFCIISNEFCERFSYYGMRTVLTLYVTNVLMMNKSDSTVFFNSFNVLCYFTPILGSILADGYIGKFWTILSVSILYAGGQILLAIAAMQPLKSKLHPALDIAGLFIIGVGTGGIKPCVSAFGGDQFELGQARMLSMYFSVFYFSINAGSMISTFVSPIFRSIPCMGEDSCYPLAFGIPAILMIVSCFVFVSGSWWYVKPPPKDNVIAEVSKTIGRAIINKVRGNGPKRDHWLEHYLTTHRCENDPKCLELQARKRRSDVCQKADFVGDVKALLRIVVMFLPVPLFWALYDQQASVWVFQSLQMDCQVGTYLLLPDQMQTVNAVLILVFIPIFQVIVYPLFSKCFNVTPLRKMVVGGLIASAAFVISAFVQLSINKTLASIPDVHHTNVGFVNTFHNCNVTILSLQTNNSFALQSGAAMRDDRWNEIQQTFSEKAGNASFALDYSGDGDCPKTPEKEITVTLTGKNIQYITLTPKGYYMGTVETDKPTDGNGEFKLSINIATDTAYTKNLALCMREDANKAASCDSSDPSTFVYWESWDGQNDDIGSQIPILHNGTTSGTKATTYAYKSVRPGTWELFYLNNDPIDISRHPEGAKTTPTNVYFTQHKQGGVYILTLTGSQQEPNQQLYQPVPDNAISILWQLPQIVVITIAEILFSITGYDFSYSQAPLSMKSMVQALWLLTTAVGDTIIVIVAAANIFDDMAIEFFAYAGIMAAVIIIFTFMSIFFYEYRYYTDAEEEDDYADEVSLGKSAALDNEGFIDNELEKIRF